MIHVDPMRWAILVWLGVALLGPICLTMDIVSAAIATIRRKPEAPIKIDGLPDGWVVRVYPRSAPKVWPIWYGGAMAGSTSAVIGLSILQTIARLVCP